MKRFQHLTRGGGRRAWSQVAECHWTNHPKRRKNPMCFEKQTKRKRSGGKSFPPRKGKKKKERKSLASNLVSSGEEENKFIGEGERGGGVTDYSFASSPEEKAISAGDDECGRDMGVGSRDREGGKKQTEPRRERGALMTWASMPGRVEAFVLDGRKAFRHRIPNRVKIVREGKKKRTGLQTVSGRGPEKRPSKKREKVWALTTQLL